MAKTSRPPTLIPYLSDGSIPCNAEEGHPVYRDDGVWEEARWVEAEDFHAVLRIERVGYGRSSAHFTWADDISGARYTMSGATFNEMLKRAEWVGPFLVDGRWRPYKKGIVYFIRPVYPEELK